MVLTAINTRDCNECFSAIKDQEHERRCQKSVKYANHPIYRPGHDCPYLAIKDLLKSVKYAMSIITAEHNACAIYSEHQRIIKDTIKRIELMETT